MLRTAPISPSLILSNKIWRKEYKLWKVDHYVTLLRTYSAGCNITSVCQFAWNFCNRDVMEVKTWKSKLSKNKFEIFRILRSKIPFRFRIFLVSRHSNYYKWTSKPSRIVWHCSPYRLEFLHNFQIRVYRYLTLLQDRLFASWSLIPCLCFKLLLPALDIFQGRKLQVQEEKRAVLHQWGYNTPIWRICKINTTKCSETSY